MSKFKIGTKVQICDTSTMASLAKSKEADYDIALDMFTYTDKVYTIMSSEYEDDIKSYFYRFEEDEGYYRFAQQLLVPTHETQYTFEVGDYAEDKDGNVGVLAIIEEEEDAKYGGLGLVLFPGYGGWEIDIKEPVTTHWNIEGYEIDTKILPDEEWQHFNKAWWDNLDNLSFPSEEGMIKYFGAIDGLLDEYDEEEDEVILSVGDIVHVPYMNHTGIIGMIDELEIEERGYVGNDFLVFFSTDYGWDCSKELENGYIQLDEEKVLNFDFDTLPTWVKSCPSAWWCDGNEIRLANPKEENEFIKIMEESEVMEELEKNKLSKEVEPELEVGDIVTTEDGSVGMLGLIDKEEGSEYLVLFLNSKEGWNCEKHLSTGHVHGLQEDLYFDFKKLPNWTKDVCKAAWWSSKEDVELASDAEKEKFFEDVKDRMIYGKKKEAKVVPTAWEPHVEREKEVIDVMDSIHRIETLLNEVTFIADDLKELGFNVGVDYGYDNKHKKVIFVSKNGETYEVIR